VGLWDSFREAIGFGRRAKTKEAGAAARDPKKTAIKKLGEISRKAIEEFLQKDVYLELRVKVRKNWRSDEKMLRAFGYSHEKDRGE
jgi:hypothetical protein